MQSSQGTRQRAASTQPLPKTTEGEQTTAIASIDLVSSYSSYIEATANAHVKLILAETNITEQMTELQQTITSKQWPKYILMQVNKLPDELKPIQCENIATKKLAQLQIKLDKIKQDQIKLKNEPFEHIRTTLQSVITDTLEVAKLWNKERKNIETYYKQRVLSINSKFINKMIKDKESKEKKKLAHTNNQMDIDSANTPEIKKLQETITTMQKQIKKLSNKQSDTKSPSRKPETKQVKPKRNNAKAKSSKKTKNFRQGASSNSA